MRGGTAEPKPEREREGWSRKKHVQVFSLGLFAFMTSLFLAPSSFCLGHLQSSLYLAIEKKHLAGLANVSCLDITLKKAANYLVIQLIALPDQEFLEPRPRNPLHFVF